ncbi:hypothetical protein [Hoeflea prorocentri]|uniref:Uncharacterized protein n=1 Tax=Hoeflea prorocentri TaxID=1922333 RepID=A0A9X3ZIJ8_9HYPH|nr:hypothetical protein [Hoeflea prorocentri]MCY6381810.1 hypothetical protein [Hoeflea prorocentri]MDA5399610.1 hypothetical protein [Hoeflea prorocentri]
MELAIATWWTSRAGEHRARLLVLHLSSPLAAAIRLQPASSSLLNKRAMGENSGQMNCPAGHNRMPAGHIIENDTAFYTFLPAETGLAVVPGCVFGQSNHFR